MCFNQSQPIRARQPLTWGSTLAYFAPTSFTIKLKDIWKCPPLRISLPYITKNKCLSLSLNSFQESKVIHGFSSIVTNDQTNTQLILEQVRRGVRSDAQLSCTETRFQKCSQSGKYGSKHPMLSISMAIYIYGLGD